MVLTDTTLPLKSSFQRNSIERGTSSKEKADIGFKDTLNNTKEKHATEKASLVQEKDDSNSLKDKELNETDLLEEISCILMEMEKENPEAFAFLALLAQKILSSVNIDNKDGINNGENLIQENKGQSITAIDFLRKVIVDGSLSKAIEDKSCIHGGINNPLEAFVDNSQFNDKLLEIISLMRGSETGDILKKLLTAEPEQNMLNLISTLEIPQDDITPEGTSSQIYFKDSSDIYTKDISENINGANIGIYAKNSFVKSYSSEGFKENSEESPGKDSSMKEMKILESIAKSGEGEGILGAFQGVMRGESIRTTEPTAVQPMIINEDTFSEDMVKVIKYIDRENLTELKLQINPKELGNLIIKVTLEGNILKASLSPSSKEAYHLLNNNLSELKANLQSGDISFKNIELNIYQEDTTYFSQGFGDGFQREERGEKSHDYIKGQSNKEDDYHEVEIVKEQEKINGLNKLV